ncbi:hypothetical protein F5Y13DRAFT_164666 [Hypoxylon sp. FL1857]|nr:hypothetical protein F5Y13DRAFT_164666 [Hypoxylon sp. FL1857]
MNSFLKVSPDYAVAQAGSGTVTVTITDDSTGQPIQGAVLGGVASDSSGHVSIPVPARAGCYQMKASKNSALRSNAFYLAVVDQFAGVQPVPQPVPQVTSPPL